MGFNANRGIRAAHARDAAARAGGTLRKLDRSVEVDIVMHGTDRTFMAVARRAPGQTPQVVLDLKHQTWDSLEAHLRHHGFTNILGARCCFPVDLAPWQKADLGLL